ALTWRESRWARRAGASREWPHPRSVPRSAPSSHARRPLTASVQCLRTAERAESQTMTPSSRAGGVTGGRRAALGTPLAVFAALVVVPAAPASGQDVRGVFANVSPSVVVIRGRGRDVGVNGRGLTAITEVGSGVVVSVDGDVMTAAHVVQAMDEITVEFAGGPTVPAHVIISEPAADLALLRVQTPPRSLIAAPLGNSDTVGVGDQVLIVGAPYGLGRSLSVGWISARYPPNTVYRAMPLAEFFQTT